MGGTRRECPPRNVCNAERPIQPNFHGLLVCISAHILYMSTYTTCFCTGVEHKKHSDVTANTNSAVQMGEPFYIRDYTNLIQALGML